MFSRFPTRLGRLWVENRLAFETPEANRDENPIEAAKAQPQTNRELSKLKSKVELEALKLAESNPEQVLRNAQNYLKNDWGKGVVELAAKKNPEAAFAIASKIKTGKAPWVMAMVLSAAEKIDVKFVFNHLGDYSGTYWIDDVFPILVRRDPDQILDHRGILSNSTWGKSAIENARMAIRPRELAKAQAEMKAKAEAQAKAWAEKEAQAKAQVEAEAQAKVSPKVAAPVAPVELPPEPPKPPLSAEKQVQADEFANSLSSQGGAKKAEVEEASKKQGEYLDYLKEGRSFSHLGKKEYDPHNEPWGGYSWSGWGKKAFDAYVKAYDAAKGDKAKDPNVQKAYENLRQATEAYPKLVDAITKELDSRYKAKVENLVRDYDLPDEVTVSNVWTAKDGKILGSYSQDLNPAMESLMNGLPEKIRTPDREKTWSEHLGAPDTRLSDLNPFSREPQSLNELFNNFFIKPFPKKTFADWPNGVGGALQQTITTKAGNLWKDTVNWGKDIIGSESEREKPDVSGLQDELKAQLGLGEGGDDQAALGKINDAILLKNMYEVEYLAKKLREEYKSDLNNALIRLDGQYGKLNPNDKNEVILAKVLGKAGPV